MVSNKRSKIQLKVKKKKPIGVKGHFYSFTMIFLLLECQPRENLVFDQI